jgi:uncharacterized protein with von Willebrand factor type A (vWA) domain
MVRPAPADHEQGPVTGVDRMAVAFARLLRGAGLDVALGSVTTFAEALAVLGVDQRGPVYWAGRTTLVRRPEDIGVYDRVFAAFWLDQRPGLHLPPESQEMILAVDAGDEEPPADGGDEEAERLPTITVRYSRTEVLRHKDFAAYTPGACARPGDPPAVPTCAAPCAVPSATAASPSTGRGWPRPSDPGGWCCSATSRDLWSPTPGPCSASSTPR